MENYDEKMNYSFEPAPEEPSRPPLEQAKEEIRRSGKHTRLKIAALLAALAIVAAVGGSVLTKTIDAIGQKNLAEQEKNASVGVMAEQPVEQEQPAAPESQSNAAYRLERTPLPETLKSNEGDKTLTPAQVYKMNIGAVCGISTQVTADLWGVETTGICTGSGFVLTEDGYIVTNHHVVADADEGTVVVQFYSGEEYPAAIVGTDSMNDIALLKIEAKGLQTVTVGDSDEVEVGETVEAIGNPLGDLTFTMTAGYISALDREIDTDGTVINMLQTDAAINSGNSGGPLFDMNGNIIGVTTAKVSGTTETGVTIEGLGFAIPINDVLRVVYDLQQYGRVRGRAYLGVTLQNLDAEVAEIYGLPSGPQVVTVTEGSCGVNSCFMLILQKFNIVDVFNGERKIVCRERAQRRVEIRRRAAVLRAVNIWVLQNVVLFINDRLLAADQNDCVLVVKPPYFIRGHKLAPGLLEILTERTVPALTLAGCPGINRFFPKQLRNIFVRRLFVAA